MLAIVVFERFCTPILLVITHAFYFQIPDYRNAVIVAKNPLAARRATSYAERLRLGIAVIHGEAKVLSQVFDAVIIIETSLSNR